MSASMGRASTVGSRAPARPADGGGDAQVMARSAAGEQEPQAGRSGGGGADAVRGVVYRRPGVGDHLPLRHALRNSSALLGRATHRASRLQRRQRHHGLMTCVTTASAPLGRDAEHDGLESWEPSQHLRQRARLAPSRASAQLRRPGCARTRSCRHGCGPPARSAREDLHHWRSAGQFSLRRADRGHRPSPPAARPSGRGAHHRCR